MIINIGKRVRVETPNFHFECDADAPGSIKVSSTAEPGAIWLPANPEGAERFIAAYRRTVAEDVGYREMKSE